MTAETRSQPSGRDGLLVDGVTVTFGDAVAVEHADLRVPIGHVVAVLGPSGCGKSTLLRAVAGLEPLASGRVCFDGADLKAVPTHRRGFAMMFQDGMLFLHASVGDNVGYALRFQGVGRAARTAEVTRLLRLVGLDGYAARRPATLSGGEQQRVALARALAARPRLLLLDEPLSSLDRSLRERLAVDLRTVLTETGTTALLVTHDHDEAFAIADTTAIMRAGRVVQVGPTAQVWRTPVDADTARFLGYDTVLTGPAAKRVLGALRLGGELSDVTSDVASGVASDVASDVTVALRRNAIRVSENGSLSAVVRTVAAAREGLRLTLDIPGIGQLPGIDVWTQADQAGSTGAGPVDSTVIRVAPGVQVSIDVDPTQIALLP